MRCPYCKERIKNQAVRCKHCHASIGANNSHNDGIRYLQNGFAKINDECNAIEDRINARTGFIFIHHQYSEEELWTATGRIESFAEKIRDDIEQWESSGQLSPHIRLIYNQKVEALHERLETLHAMIQQREPTWWEKVCAVFRRIAEKLLPLLSFRLIKGGKNPKQIAA